MTSPALRNLAPLMLQGRTHTGGHDVVLFAAHVESIVELNDTTCLIAEMYDGGDRP